MSTSTHNIKDKWFNFYVPQDTLDLAISRHISNHDQWCQLCSYWLDVQVYYITLSIIYHYQTCNYWTTTVHLPNIWKKEEVFCNTDEGNYRRLKIHTGFRQKIIDKRSLCLDCYIYLNQLVEYTYVVEGYWWRGKESTLRNNVVTKSITVRSLYTTSGGGKICLSLEISPGYWTDFNQTWHT